MSDDRDDFAEAVAFLAGDGPEPSEDPTYMLNHLLSRFDMPEAEKAAMLRQTAEWISPSERAGALRRATTGMRVDSKTALTPAERKRRSRRHRRLGMREIRLYVSQEHVAILAQRSMIPDTAEENVQVLARSLERLIGELAEVLQSRCDTSMRKYK